MSNVSTNSGQQAQQQQADWVSFAKAQQERLSALETAVRRPLPEEDIRNRQGKGYLSGGDILLNLLEDFGPFAYETTIKRLEWTPPREDRRQREVNKKTGEVVYDTGYTCVGVAVVTLILTLPDGRKVLREGAGTCGSDMQQSPEAAIENAVKGAETDALKRACVGLGPRYGLALRFNDRDDDRQALGLVERNKKLDEARKRRDEQQKPTTQGTPKSSPEDRADRPVSAAGASPAVPTTEQRAEARPAGSSAAPAAGTSPAAAFRIPHAAEDAARREALRKAEIPADVLKAREAAAGRATEIQDAGLRERAGASLLTARTLEQVATTRGGIEKILAKQASKPDPSAAGASAPPSSPSTASASRDTEAARLGAARRIATGDFDQALANALRLGGYPGAQAPFDDVSAWPNDQSEADLRELGWSAKGAEPADLALVDKGDPLPQPMQSALIGEAVKRLGREAFAGVWRGLGGPDKGGLLCGYQARLLASAVAYRTAMAGMTK